MAPVLAEESGASPGGAGVARQRPQRRPGASPDRDERDLFIRYRATGEPALRDALVQRFLPLARKLAGRYRRGGEPMDDLRQVASLGLLKAVERYDPGHGTAFSSFAVPTILGELRRHFRDTGWAIHVPRDLQELAVKVEAVGDGMHDDLGRPATADELAARLGVGPGQILEAREAAAAHYAASLDSPVLEDGEGRSTLGDVLGSEDPELEAAESGVTAQRLLRHLGRREQEILRLRFAEDLTQSEIGARLGISQMHVSRLIRQSLEHLREVAAAQAAAVAAHAAERELADAGAGTALAVGLAA